MLKLFSFLIMSFFLVSCTGTHERNMAKLDEELGCKNPHRVYSERKYKSCLARERAGGETMFDLTDSFDKLLGNEDTNVVYQNSVNTYLWSAGLEVTRKYPLKIADNQGGFIETQWIYNSSNSDQRCLIKIQIKSKELITTGVSSSFLCEIKQDDEWIADNKDYIQEEKQITLKILEIAGNLAKASL